MSKRIDTVVILDQASGYLQIDMLEAYSKRFKNRSIIAGTIVERGTLLSNEICWHRITKYNRSTTFKRLYTWLKGTLDMFWIVLIYYRKAHIVAITNPPFSVFVPWLLRCSYDVVVYDMYPDALVHYGYVKRTGFIFKFWEYLNKRVFKNAKRVITLTEGMADLVNAYMPKGKTAEIIPLWSDSGDFQKIPRSENKILQQTNSINKFVIVYSGNLGTTHPVEKLVELAEFLDPHLFSIIIIGDGAKKKKLLEICNSKQLPHVYLLPWQPIEMLSHNLYAGDLNAVTLDEQASDLSIPSKTFNILSIGNPIFGICSKNSALAKLILKNNCGIVASTSEMEIAAEQIKTLQASETLLISLKNNSVFANKNFTKVNAEKYLECIEYL